MTDFDLNGSQGYYQDGENLISFEILGADIPGIVDIDKFNNLNMPVLYNVGKHKVLVKGLNNLLPDEIELMVGGNRLLPELIEKQVRILFGTGPQVYKIVKDGKKQVREWEGDNIITDWLDSWHVNGLADSSEQYTLKVIRDFYYFEDYWAKWRYTMARRTGGAMPVLGLEHIDNRRSRLGTTKPIDLNDDPEDKDFESVIVGNWMHGNERKFKIYNRFLPNAPFSNPVAVSYHKNASVGKVYGTNKIYEGIKDWLLGMKRHPKYINSFLKNTLSAKVHVIIPAEWLTSIETKLEQYCEENAEREDAGKTLLKPNDIEIGTKYSVSIRDKYVASEMRKLSKFLSGVENQGKIYTTYSYTTDDGNPVQWKIEPLDLKYSEYITTLDKHDKRADEILLSSKGLDASISSISKEGVISKSGSDLYYNYLIYLHNLSTAERICLEAVNMAVRLNFPKLYAEKYRVGFYNEVPSKQEDVAPNDRLQNTVNQVAQKVTNLTTQVEELRITQINLPKT